MGFKMASLVTVVIFVCRLLSFVCFGETLRHTVDDGSVPDGPGSSLSYNPFLNSFPNVPLTVNC